ncbi:hypothetical protein, partial [Hyphomonas atlantica]|uniref:hypothetical protein n=1 Tax=Hyphomonas atlantica TaxID=1280948 RepID=UPI00054DD3A4
MPLNDVIKWLAASSDTLIDGLAAFVGALVVGLLFVGLYRIFSSSLFDRMLIPFLRGFDRLLVHRVAPSTGVTLQTTWRRWLVFAGTFLALVAVAVFAPVWAALAATFIGLFLVLAIYRAWEADETERQQKEDMNEVVSAGNDLGNEILIGLVFLVVFFTLGFSRLSEVTPIYKGVPNIPFAQSAVYVWGEFLKAVPFVDASEVFGWNNVSGLQASGSVGRTITFILRASMDLILLAAILRTLSIVRRRAEGADLRDIRNMLSSSEESQMLAGIDRLGELSMRNRLNAQRELERIALREVEGNSTIAEPQYLTASGNKLQELTEKFGSQRFVIVAVEAYRAALEVRT